MQEFNIKSFYAIKKRRKTGCLRGWNHNTPISETNHNFLT